MSSSPHVGADKSCGYLWHLWAKCPAHQPCRPSKSRTGKISYHDRRQQQQSCRVQTSPSVYCICFGKLGRRWEMKRILYMFMAVWGTCWMVSSCNTMRKKVENKANHRYTFTQSVAASDSAMRYWHFASDSAFAYHPDSGLRTTSGHLLGWELSTKRRLEQQIRDSVSNYEHGTKELTRDSRNRGVLCSIVFFLLLFLGLIVAYRRFPLVLLLFEFLP